jgi:hypothetical protein
VISIEDGANFHFDVTFNGVTTSSPTTDESGFLEFDKDVNYVETADIEIIHTGYVVLDVTVGCPDAQELKIVRIVLTNDSESGDSIHAEYRYTSGSYTSPTQSNFVTFASGTSNPLVSLYSIVAGYEGTAGFPFSGSTIRIQTNKQTLDTFDFDPTSDNFRYYRSDTLYTSSSVDLNILLAAATTSTPILGGGTTYYSDFTMPSTGEYLYLIWDFRTSTAIELCHDEYNVYNVCCQCGGCNSRCATYDISAPEGLGPVEIQFPSGLCGIPVPYRLNLNEGESTQICIEDQPFNIIEGSPIIFKASCDCDPCNEDCWTFQIDNILSLTGRVTIAYVDCFGERQLVDFTDPAEICTPIGTYPEIFDGFCNITLLTDCGCCRDTCVTWTFRKTTPTAQVRYRDCVGDFIILDLSSSVFAVCGDKNFYPEILSGDTNIELTCGCII